MGVQGLTTYLREHNLAISKKVKLHKRDALDDVITPNVNIVVDGWAFIYMWYYSSRLPWVYGGEYDQFAAVVRWTVEAWLSLGINLSFVFDGAQEPLKFQTKIKRLTENVHHSALFFRTSHATRMTPRFLNETRILPPLVYAACTEALLQLSSQSHGRLSRKEGSGDASTDAVEGPNGTLDVYFADREADPFMVELAGRLGAYITSLDSDFVILNVPGYRGYIPLDEMEWTASTLPSEPRTRTLSLTSSVASLLSPSEISEDASIWNDLAEIEDQEGGFVPVTKKKRSRVISAKSPTNPSKPSTVGDLIPPPDYVSLSFPVYTPESTAASLGIPPSLLPLLAGMVGNEYTHTIKNNAQSKPIFTARPGSTHHDFIYEHKLSAPKRVIYTANILSTTLQNQKRKNKGRGSVLDIIRSAVTQMLVRPNLTTEREIDVVVNRVVESALQYAIPPSSYQQTEGPKLWPTFFCPLHEDIAQCRLDAFLPDEQEDGEKHPTQSPHTPLRSTEPRKEEATLSIIQNQYIRAYREGSFDPYLMDILITGTMWPRTFLESPDLASTSGALDASGTLRKWVYAVLDQGIGVYIPPPPEEDEEHAEQQQGAGASGADSSSQEDDDSEEDDDEIIDVIDEEDEFEEQDPLAALKGALQRLRGTAPGHGEGVLPTIPDGGVKEEDEDTEDNGDEGGEDQEECYVTEYVRRGARFSDERVQVDELHSLIEATLKLADPTSPSPGDFGQLASPSTSWNHNIPVPRTSRHRPIQLEDKKTRLAVLLTACHSDTKKVRDLRKEWIGPVIITRYLVWYSGMKEREKEKAGGVISPFLRRWSKGEIKALLCAFGVDENLQSQEQKESQDDPKDTTEEHPWVFEKKQLDTKERTIQLMARSLSVIEATRMLIQALCLTRTIPLALSKFKGRKFHELCQDASILGSISNGIPAQDASMNVQVDPNVWDAVEEGLETFIGDDRVKKAKKKETSKGANKAAKGGAASKNAGRGGFFSVLSDAM
ncbi:hypothetical protein CPB86DRAFT_870366 [Serendipita vermifera]|nr:hypothetical protein CPB86DRAFT_870366 [Serendipita vermifera]